MTVMSLITPKAAGKSELYFKKWPQVLPQMLGLAKKCFGVKTVQLTAD
jgi:hypothetical protein